LGQAKLTTCRACEMGGGLQPGETYRFEKTRSVSPGDRDTQEKKDIQERALRNDYNTKSSVKELERGENTRGPIVETPCE